MVTAESRPMQPSEPWDIVPYIGGALFKHVRVRHRDVIETVANYVRKQHYVIVLGPHYSEKSRLLEDVRQTLNAEPQFCTVFVNLWKARSDDDATFFSSLQQLMITNLPLDVDRSMTEPDDAAFDQIDVTDARSFQNFLDACRKRCGRHLVLFVDHLHALPHDLIHQLLQALRAAYMEPGMQDGPRLSVVATGGMNLAELSHSATSPFNIARPVNLPPLDVDQSRALAEETLKCYGVPYTKNALDRIQACAGGDRYLIPKLCEVSQDVVAGYKTRRITHSVVEQATSRLAREESDLVSVRLGIQLIEEDPDTLLDVMSILYDGSLPRTAARQDIVRGANRLLLSGAVILIENAYRFKNEFYRRALAAHFTPEQVARVLRMSGRWADAIDYLTHSPDRSVLDRARIDLLEAIVQSIYAADALDEAYAALAKGMRYGFGLTDFRVYRADAAHRQLHLVHADASSVSVSTTSLDQDIIELAATDRVETQTFRNSDYALRSHAGHKRLIAALVPEKRPIGLVTVEKFSERGDHASDSPHLLELLRFLRHAAAAIENVILRSAFQEIGRAVLDAGAVGASLSKVLGTVTNAVGCDIAVLYLTDESGDVLEYTSSVGRTGTVEDFPRIRLSDDHPAARCASAALGRVQTDTPDHKFARNSIPFYRVDRDGAPQHVRVFLPLLAQQRCLGVLMVGYEKVRGVHFTQDDLETLEAFADQAAIAVYNMQLLKRTDDALNQRVVELEKLQDINRTITSSLDLDSVLSRIIENVQSLFTGTEVTIWRYSPDAKRFSILGSSIRDDTYSSQTLDMSSVAGRAVQERSLQTVEDMESRLTSQSWAVALCLGLRSLMVVPLINRGEPLGVLSIYLNSPHRFTSTQRELLTSIASQAAVAIDNARQYAELHEAQQKLKAARGRDLFDISSVLLHRLGGAVGDIPFHLDIVRGFLSEHGLDHASLTHIQTRATSLRDLLPPFETVVNLAETKFAPIDFRKVVQQAVGLATSCVYTHIQYDIPDRPAWVYGDQAALCDAVQSIVENGCEAMDDDKAIRLTMTIVRDNWVRLTIRDQGAGIPQDTQSRIFELGFSTRHTPAQKRGRGLFTCRAILQKHSGEVELLETGPQGTAFEIILPIVPDTADLTPPYPGIGKSFRPQ